MSELGRGFSGRLVLVCAITLVMTRAIRSGKFSYMEE